MKENAWRTRTRAALDESRCIIEAVDHLFADIGVHTRVNVRKASIKAALTRLIELFYDDLVYVTGVRIIIA